jgi:beta-phosphoglucomutase
MDGVIIDSMEYHAKSWVKILLDKGLNITEKDIYITEGIKPSEFIEKVYHDNSRKIDPAQISLIIDEKVEYFYKNYSLKLFPDAKEIIEILFEKGFLLAIVSGSIKKSVEKVLTEFELNQFFHFVVHSDLVKKGKPHPETFIKACTGLNVKPEECICIENAPYGIIGAKSAGVFVCGISTTLNPEILYSAGANIVFENHKEICKYILNNAELISE